MALTNPSSISAGDLVTAALRETNALGVGQTPLAEEITYGQAMLQFLLAEWERKRWLVYHLVTLSVECTGAESYSIGPMNDYQTPDINTNQFNSQFAPQFGQSVRPARIESAFIRQTTPSTSLQPDYPLEELKSREDYNRVQLKAMQSIPAAFFYDSAWPLGYIYPVPVPNSQYSLFVSVMEQLPTAFATSATFVSLPYEYYYAIITNLAIRLRPSHGILTQPGDPLLVLAKNALATLRGANTQIGRLVMPGVLGRSGSGYNVYSDQIG